MGARLRARRLGEDPNPARAGAEPESDRRGYAAGAAQYYPADSWLSLLDGSNAAVASKVKNSCLICHQIGWPSS
jgi:hypothetical protein